MTNRASGTFEVTLNPQTSYNQDEGSTLGRLSIDKQFHGEVDGKHFYDFEYTLTQTS
jgi:hypothetical protein